MQAKPESRLRDIFGRAAERPHIIVQISLLRNHPGFDAARFRVDNCCVGKHLPEVAMRVARDGRSIETRRGDITQQDVDAVVNAANAQLGPGGGVAGAIHRAAGPELWEACRPLGGCGVGEAKVTDGFALPARWIVHTVGPVYGRDEPSAELLAASYRNSLAAADGLGARSIAFPALSTGAFGYPMEEAAEVAFRELLDGLPACSSLHEVRMVLFSDADLAVHDPVLRRRSGATGWE